ncbi:TP53 regulating kinase [Kappamyces sp. JEL0829]|nr:TP53 regulating kinase [Kappamyces sp. JEL0829]
MAQLLKQGAEGRVFLLSSSIIAKQRFKKSYRIAELDEKLTKERVVQEARMLVRLAKLPGVYTPLLYLVDMSTATIYMEYLDCPSIRDYLETNSSRLGYPPAQDTWPGSVSNAPPPQSEDRPALKDLAWIASHIGQGLARIHDVDIIHGDLTTSNLMLDGDRVVWIDFGLSFVSTMAEDKGVDLYVLERAIHSTHPRMAEELVRCTG